MEIDGAKVIAAGCGLATVALLMIGPVIGARTCGSVEASMVFVPFLAAGTAGVALRAATEGRPPWLVGIVITVVVLAVLIVGEVALAGATIDTHYCP